MEVNDFGDWPLGVLQKSVGPETQKNNIVFRIYSGRFEPAEQTIGASGYGMILPVHDDPGDDSFWVVQLSSEPWDERQHDVGFEWGLLVVGGKDAVVEGIGYLVFYHVAPLDCRNEELVLNVDEVLGVAYKGEVGVMNRLLSEGGAAADGPAAHRPQHLASEPSRGIFFLLADHGQLLQVAKALEAHIVDISNFLDFVLHILDDLVEFRDGFHGVLRLEVVLGGFGLVGQHLLLEVVVGFAGFAGFGVVSAVGVLVVLLRFGGSTRVF